MSRIADFFRRRTASPAVVEEPGPATFPVTAPEKPAAEVPATGVTKGWYWMQHPMVRARTNALISGSRHADAYGRLADFLAEDGRTGPLAHCAVLGCGEGGLDRGLVGRGMVGAIDGYDPSGTAIAEARRLAAGPEYGHLRYHAADIAGLVLPEGRFDAVFAHGILETLEDLDAVMAAVRRALKPDGLFHLNEFVGPTRFQWTDAQLDLINGFLDTLPERLLRTPAGRKPPVERPTVEQVVANAPNRAVRSAEIRASVARHFDILDERPYGGTLLHLGLADIAQNFDPENAEDVAHLERFFALEDRALTEGGLGSDFTVLTAGLPSASRAGLAARASAGPAPFGTAPTRQLHLPPGVAQTGLDLTVSKADTMLGTAEGDDHHYVAVGQSALAAVERALEGREPRGILDLPCGFGRVTRALRARFPQAAITVSDLDRPGVDFSARLFGARAAYSVPDLRTLDLGEAYDLIWVGSLATHLPVAQTKHLLAALRRHLTPGGTLLFTLQGPSIIPRLRTDGYGLSPADALAVIEEYERTGFGYRDYVGERDAYGVSVTNDNYGISLTDETWMAAAAAECGLLLQAYETKAWDDHQDIAVLRRPEEA